MREIVLSTKLQDQLVTFGFEIALAQGNVLDAAKPDASVTPHDCLTWAQYCVTDLDRRSSIENDECGRNGSMRQLR